VVLLATAAQAHAVAFDFVDPDGAGNRTDGGLYLVSWIDGPDPAGTTLVRLHASRPSLLPWGEVDGGATVDITPGGVAVADSNDTYLWDTAGVAAGCWHPWARMTDPIEGSSTIVSRGLVTVVNSGNVPPSVWVTNALAETASDAGIFSLRFEVDDPDDATTVTLEAQQSTGAPRRLATDLPFPVGGGNGSFPVDIAQLGGGVWYLHATVRDADGGTCDSWWPGALYLNGASDAGVDAGAPDSGSGGAGGGTGGAGGGGEAPPKSCGCGATGGFSLVALLLLAAAHQRQQRQHRHQPARR
jgi:hypothetical protein